MHIDNVLLYKDYEDYLKHTRGSRGKSLNKDLSHNYSFVKVLGNRNIKGFNKELAKSIKSQSLGDSLRSYLAKSKSWIHFMEYVIEKPGYKRISKTDLKYLQLTSIELANLINKKVNEYIKVQEYKELFFSIDDSTEVGKRNKFIVALLALVGCRITAALTLSLKCFDSDQRKFLFHKELGVDNKGDNDHESIIFNYVSEIYDYIFTYIEFLKSEKQFGSNDPIIPNIERTLGYFHPASIYIGREFVKNDDTIRKMLKLESEKAGIKYYTPHKYRHSCIYYGLEVLGGYRDIRIEKALTYNFGHKTTKMIREVYAHLPAQENSEILQSKNYDLDKNNPKEREKLINQIQSYPIEKIEKIIELLEM